MPNYYRALTCIPVVALAFFLPGKNIKSNYNKIRPLITDSLFDMCSVMPGDEVASLSPFTNPIKQVTSIDRLDGYCGCHYDLDAKDDFPQVQIEVNEFSTAKESKENYVTRKQDWVNIYQRQPVFISNLGDSANFCGNAEPGKCDDCGLEIASGRFYISVYVKGYYDKISESAKIAACIALAKKLMEKKPYLNSRK